MRNKKYLIFKAGIIFACLIFFTGAGPKKVTIKRTGKGGYILRINRKPFIVKGVIYNPTPVGEGYDYDFFSDPNKPWLEDGKLMKEMGVNTVRIYSCSEDLTKVKEFIKDMYERFGIYTIIGDWLGLWEHPGPNYADEEFRQRTKESILRKVKALKDQEGLLMWILGNENNYTFSGGIVFWTSPQVEKIENLQKRIFKKAEIYYCFVDEIARDIKKIDRHHPIALGNGEISMLNVAAPICKNVDALAIVCYRGKRLGNFFENVRYAFDKPVLVSEFGCDSYDAYKNQEAEDIQAEYLTLQWQDIFSNSVVGKNKQGNCLGATIFAWTDEWWKHNEGYSPDWCVHNKEAGWSNGSFFFDIRAERNLNMNEEWFGIVAISQEKENNINKRIPKKAYFALKELWAK